MRNIFLTMFLRLVITILVLSTTMSLTSGCSILKRDKQSIAEKKQKEADKKATAEYEKARKLHNKNQSKDAKKMMKQTRKQANKYNAPRKRKGFFNIKCD
jgi:hypothetical protein